MHSIERKVSKMKSIHVQPLYAVTGTILLALLIVSAGLLSSCGAAQSAASAARSSSITPTTAHPPAQMVSLPTPAAALIAAPVATGHNVALTMADGVAYLSTLDNAVYALRISDGTLLWRQSIAGSVDLQPVIFNGVVYVNSYEGQNGPDHVYALQASNGRIIWRYTPNGYTYIASTTGADDTLYLSSQNGIFALQASNGHVLWHYTTQGSGDDWPVVVNGVVYATTSVNGQSAALFALRADDGGLLWRYQEGNSMTTPVVANGVVYVFSDDGKLTALQASEGYTLWQRTLDANMAQSLQLVDGVMYMAVSNITEPTATVPIANPGQGLAAIGGLFWNALQTTRARLVIPLKQAQSSVYAIRASDGAILWRYLLRNGVASWVGWLVVGNGIVYASDFADTTDGTGDGDSDIYALQSSTGAVTWHDRIQASSSDALLASGVIYLVGSYNNLSSSVTYALRAGDGAYLWNYSMSGYVYNAPVQSGTTLYIAGVNGMVYALHMGNGAIQWYYKTNVGI